MLGGFAEDLKKNYNVRLLEKLDNMVLEMFPSSQLIWD